MAFDKDAFLTALDSMSVMDLNDLVKAIGPRFIRLTAKWYVRGGIFTTVMAEHRKKGWKPAPLVEVRAVTPSKSTRE